MELLQTALTLFLVFDPFGNAPVFHTVLTRLMGLVLIMVAVQMFLDGLEAWAAHSPHT